MQQVKLRTLMWVDCIAAFSSAISNAVFFKTFAAIFQLPPDLLLLLMAISFVYGLYSLSLALKFYVHIPMVRLLVVANFLYSVFCVALAIYFGKYANSLGIAYLAGESIVVSLLAFIEFKKLAQISR